VLVVLALILLVLIRARNLHRWLPDYLAQTGDRRKLSRTRNRALTDVLVCVADHFEPRWETRDAVLEKRRVQTWCEQLPTVLAGREDSDGQRPQHSFFFPGEEYSAELLDMLAKLCAQGYGEIEVHLHHGNDSEASLRKALQEYVNKLHLDHGALGINAKTGQPGYVFIHGNWALCNSAQDASVCGVNNEISLLRDTGCYADMTLPSAPSITQVNMVNRIYYARSSADATTGHSSGVVVGQGGACPSDKHLMLIPGPLGLSWHNRKFGLLPRIENAELAQKATCSDERIDSWLRYSCAVEGAQNWRFLKLHCHGAQEKDSDIMLGRGCKTMYSLLERRFRDSPGYRLHYVTAREMYNIVCAAEAGERGDPNLFRDYRYLPPSWKVNASATGFSAGQ
jgi:hypothetical protein